MDFSLVFRTTPELAQDLRRLAPALPEMPEAAPVVDVSLGLKIGELASLLGRWAAAIEQAPFRCEGLAPLNDLAAGFRAAAANPAVGMASMAGEGVLLRVDRIDLSNLQQPDFEATVVLAAPNPQGVVALLAGAMPEIANLGLVPGADPVAVPASALPTGIRSAFAALGERAAAVGFNHADGARVKRLVAAPTDARHRMFSIELTGVLVARAYGGCCARTRPRTRRWRRTWRSSSGWPAMWSAPPSS
ncbi:MAG: hypothetical protein RML12_08730 [Xanthomonadales bacterium]|nr:hypothetical protein [Xanthomonadales bacterium]